MRYRPNWLGHILTVLPDTTIRAIGKRAHPMHNLVAFSTLCVVVSTVACVYSSIHEVSGRYTYISRRTGCS